MPLPRLALDGTEGRATARVSVGTDGCGRSLEYAFRESFDLTPAAFLRLRRLHCARLRLLAADPADMAVTDIAYQEGFYHRGRFAAAYAATFGEPPSQTLRRPCPRELSRLLLTPPLQRGVATDPPRSRVRNASPKPPA
jgi:AraC-like DNA-binding protein